MVVILEKHYSLTTSFAPTTAYATEPSNAIFLYYERQPKDGRKMGARIPEIHRKSLALLALVLMACLSGAGVQWQYETSSGEPSQSQSSATSAGAAYEPASQITAPAETAGEGESTDKKGGLWSWGGAPKGFSVSNGTLQYPPGYYTPWMGLPDSYYGYTWSGLYPTYNEPKVYHGYSFGFATGAHPGFTIMGLLYPNDTSGYDPWNNYPGYDPRFPYEIRNNTVYRIYPSGGSYPLGYLE
ncbi:MAG: hypothetical protein A4E48_01255 [Methanosaeta sp. PtaU1.Bin060]|nr:MAG: hypothetical protein A4E48_01255 [Methanosaeta sp. PtaU1.Bin060]